MRPRCGGAPSSGLQSSCWGTATLHKPSVLSTLTLSALQPSLPPLPSPCSTQRLFLSEVGRGPLSWDLNTGRERSFTCPSGWPLPVPSGRHDLCLTGTLWGLHSSAWPCLPGASWDPPCPWPVAGPYTSAQQDVPGLTPRWSEGLGTATWCPRLATAHACPCPAPCRTFWLLAWAVAVSKGLFLWVGERSCWARPSPALGGSLR